MSNNIFNSTLKFKNMNETQKKNHYMNATNLPWMLDIELFPHVSLNLLFLMLCYQGICCKQEYSK